MMKKNVLNLKCKRNSLKAKIFRKVLVFGLSLGLMSGYKSNICIKARWFRCSVSKC